MKTKESEYSAFCLTCGKEWRSINAGSVGSRHARKYNHHVITQKTIRYYYIHKQAPIITDEMKDD